MKLSTHYISPKYIELVIESDNIKITESITNYNGVVDRDLIENVESILDELKLHNYERLKI